MSVNRLPLLKHVRRLLLKLFRLTDRILHILYIFWSNQYRLTKISFYIYGGKSTGCIDLRFGLTWGPPELF